MQFGLADELIDNIRDLFTDEQTRLHVSLRQGLSIKQYQIQNATHEALVMALGILETFNRERENYFAKKSVKESLKLLQERNENSWKDLQINERLQRLMAGVGFLAADIGLSDEAEALFASLSLLSPDNVHPLLGIAYTKLVSGFAQEALEVIRNKVLNMAPGNDLGLAFLALAYDELNKPEEALAAAAAVITADRDESAVALALEVQRSLDHPEFVQKMAF